MNADKGSALISQSMNADKGTALISQSMNADKGSALISQSMNTDKGTAISRAKNISFVVRNTLLPYIVFAKIQRL